MIATYLDQRVAVARLAENEEHLDWVVREFRGYSAARLEIAATIVYADQELREGALPALVRVVNAVKPKYPAAEITQQAEILLGMGLTRGRTCRPLIAGIILTTWADGVPRGSRLDSFPRHRRCRACVRRNHRSGEKAKPLSLP
jgi:hypothetical protein